MKFIENLMEIPPEKKYALSDMNDETLSIYINKLYDQKKENILIVTNTLYEANKLYQSLQNYNSNVLFFPMDEFLMSEAIAVSPDLKITRIETINELCRNEKRKIVITHLMGFLRYLPSKKEWINNIIEIKLNQNIKKEELLKILYKMGYCLEDIVTKTGEMANRGYILDVFPINESNAIRIEFWGDTIESIRYFDVETQLSLSNTDKKEIYPFHEFLVDIEDEKRKQKYLPFFTDTVSIFDYMDDPILIYKDYNQINNSYIRLREEIFNYSLNIKEEYKTNYMYNLENISGNNEIYVMGLENITDKKRYSFLTKEANFYNGDFKRLNDELKDYLESNKTIIICLNSAHQINSFKSYINLRSIITDVKNIYENSINIIENKINNGFIFQNYVVLGEKNLFKFNDIKAIYKSSFKYGTRIKDINKLKTGDYIVHSVHGIGKFAGIVSIEKNNIIKDYLKIEYKDNGKLYIPVEKIDLISKYSSNEGAIPKLNKLGGTEWYKTKMDVKAKIANIANILIGIAVERESKKGYAFSSDTKEQDEFEKEFVYESTADQLISTEQIKNDMEKEKPMDRILCGDVGYGKTEVAFRAMFKAICDNKQVAYLCPTTLLSNQQYKSALERFKGFPINIALINRFTSKKSVKEIIDGITNKKIDIIFGTHRLLSNDIKFKDLGLLVIDEEQRFGVIHKEKIKQYKANIDVLTLSATPIPRTLQMAMVGLRSLSLIETPPVNRYPIQTYVMEENDYIIKDAIYKEMSRNGQVYILYNKIENIGEKVEEISKIVPDAKISYAHGRMSKSEIEDIMIKFINNEFDVLVCTTIIETGIDIPNVNTLIIIDSDKFGLSQLYQIRGRVGRTNKIAYAYLMYNKRKVLSEIATKRLNAIKEFTELGSGFSISMRDLSIRGAGDVLGSEQSGFIDTIGIDLYLKMLNEEILKIKGKNEEKEENVDEQPLINIATHINDNYVSSDDIKIEIHKKINQIDSYEKLVEVKNEIEDRFGKVSEEILLYMYEEWFEKLAKEKGVEKVIQNKLSVEIIFHSNVTSKMEINNIFMKAYEVNNNFRFSYLNKRLKVTLNISNLEKHWLYYLLAFINQI